MTQFDEAIPNSGRLSAIVEQVDIFNVLSEQFDRAFTSELEKLVVEEQSRIAMFCLRLSTERKLHIFFTENNLLSLNKIVFENEEYRDFVLNLTDKLSFRINYNENSGFSLAKYLSNAISIVKDDTLLDHNQCMVPKVYLQNMSIYSDEIELTLKNNKWLMTLVLINIFFFETQIARTQSESEKTTTGRFKNKTESPT